MSLDIKLGTPEKKNGLEGVSLDELFDFAKFIGVDIDAYLENTINFLSPTTNNLTKFVSELFNNRVPVDAILKSLSTIYDIKEVILNSNKTHDYVYGILSVINMSTEQLRLFVYGLKNNGIGSICIANSISKTSSKKVVDDFRSSVVEKLDSMSSRQIMDIINRLDSIHDKKVVIAILSKVGGDNKYNEIIHNSVLEIMDAIIIKDERYNSLLKSIVNKKTSDKRTYGIKSKKIAESIHNDYDLEKLISFLDKNNDDGKFDGLIRIIYNQVERGERVNSNVAYTKVIGSLVVLFAIYLPIVLQENLSIYTILLSMVASLLLLGYTLVRANEIRNTTLNLLIKKYGVKESVS